MDGGDRQFVKGTTTTGGTESSGEGALGCECCPSVFFYLIQSPDDFNSNNLAHTPNIHINKHIVT